MRNPSAFPHDEQAFNADFGRIDREPSTGMSLRDYFAAKALQGSLARQDYIYESDAAEAAYKYADAMLAERVKP